MRLGQCFPAPEDLCALAVSISASPMGTPVWQRRRELRAPPEVDTETWFEFWFLLIYFKVNPRNQGICPITVIFFLFFFTILCGIQDFSFLTMDRTHASSSAVKETSGRLTPSKDLPDAVAPHPASCQSEDSFQPFLIYLG
ncbi:TPA: hypothetical protein BOS_16264 [Bos taurus]|nr:TPA: hypothetical protein BOS_16264 [Bos taurus]